MFVLNCLIDDTSLCSNRIQIHFCTFKVYEIQRRICVIFIYHMLGPVHMTLFLDTKMREWHNLHSSLSKSTWLQGILNSFFTSYLETFTTP